MATTIRWAHDVGSFVEHETMGEVIVHSHFYNTAGGRGYTIRQDESYRNCREEELTRIPPTCVCGFEQPENAGGMAGDTLTEHIYNRNDGKTSEHYKVRG